MTPQGMGEALSETTKLQRESRASFLRDAFAQRQLIRVAGAHDGLTARLAEEAGFEAVWASGLEISAAQGVPDLSLLGLTEFLTAATAMHRATTLPVIADCDTGFGGNLNAAYTMMGYEQVGIAAISIEDKVFPKQNSFLDGSHALLDASEFATKLEVVKAAQSYVDTVLIARTEALISGLDTDEALRRCHLYVDAGADAVLVHSKKADSSEVVDFMRKWNVRAPVIIVPTTYFDFSIPEAEEAGVAMVIYANQGMRAAVAAVRETWAAVLADRSSASVEPNIASMKDVFRLSGVDNWLGMER